MDVRLTRRKVLAAAVGAGASLGTASWALSALAGQKDRGIVRGSVSGAGKPLAGVLVSDGCRVVRTGSDGRYELPIGPDSGRFVFITTPRDYWTDAFFVPLHEAVRRGRADFTLRRQPQPDVFRFAFITDMHLENRKVAPAKFTASLREINSLEPQPAFVWAQGDICLQGHSGPVYVECLKVLKMPVRNGAGNHEMMLDHANPRDRFEELFGPTYYSFDWGPVHCIVLDGNKPLPGQKGWKAVLGAVEGSEWAWLQADLAAQPKGKPIIVGVHIPVVTTYPERRDDSPKNAPYWEITNRQQLTNLFAKHRVRLVLQGHMHENERITVDGVEYVASISISGSWWKAGEGFERGVDASPRGYRIVEIDGDRVTHFYRPSCESYVDRRGEFCGLDEPLRADGPIDIVFNCYDAPNGSPARARVDQGPWQAMKPFAARSATTPTLTMTHHYRLRLESGQLAPGKHRVEVEATWPDGTVVRQHGTFRVVPAKAAAAAR